LLREVNQRMMSGPRRRRLHRALAEATPDEDEAAGHIAAGAEEPDEAAAAIVEAAARRTLARGAPARAAVLAEAAGALTPDRTSPSIWQRRLLLVECLDVA